MKTLPIFRFTPVLLLLALATPAAAQAPAFEPVAQGYWNVETNLRSPEMTTVRFYNNQHALVHETRVSTRRFALNRRRFSARTTKRLNSALQQVLGQSQTTACSRMVSLPRFAYAPARFSTPPETHEILRCLFAPVYPRYAHH